MHRPQFFTWTTHTAETTTLLEATRLQKLYTYMCNIVTEFYLYSIVYIYLINSRLDVTHSVHHHFCTIQTLSHYSRLTPKLKFLYQEQATQEQTTNTPRQFGKLYWYSITVSVQPQLSLNLCARSFFFYG